MKRNRESKSKIRLFSYYKMNKKKQKWLEDFVQKHKITYKELWKSYKHGIHTIIKYEMSDVMSNLFASFKEVDIPLLGIDYCSKPKKRYVDLNQKDNFTNKWIVKEDVRSVGYPYQI